MGGKHLTREFFQSLGDSGSEQYRALRQLRDHLLESCSVCRQEYEAYLAGHYRRAGTEARDPEVFGLGREQEWEVKALVDFLHSVPAEARLRALADREMSADQVEELVLALCEETRSSEPEPALVWAELAEQVVVHFGDLPAQGAQLVQAIAYQGNSLYRQAQGQEALRETQRAWRALREYQVQDEETLADLQRLSASVHLQLGHFDTSAELLLQAEQLYSALNLTIKRASTLIKLGMAYECLGDPERATEVTYQAIHLFRPWEQPKLYVAGFCNLATFLCSRGKFADALEVAMVDGAMVEDMDATTQLNYQWLLARIYEGLGDDRAAERHFRQARAGFVELGNGYDSAILCLHLASLYYRNYRRDEALEMAGQALHLGRTHGLHPEAQAALVLLNQTLRSRTTAGLILAEVPRFLRTVREDPSAKFHLPES